MSCPRPTGSTWMRVDFIVGDCRICYGPSWTPGRDTPHETMRSKYSCGPQLRVDTRRGLLRGARFAVSPNRDARPRGMRTESHRDPRHQPAAGRLWRPVDRAAVHQQVAGGRASVFRAGRGAPGLLAPAAAPGRRNYPVRGFTDRAWHAGKSRYQGREACNDFSVGVDWRAPINAYEDVQYRALARLSPPCSRPIRICRRADRRPCDIAPGRKSDPGGSFDWPRARTW